MIPHAFGTPGAVLYPPAADQLLAEASCTQCPWVGTKYVWPMVARVGVGGQRIEMPVGTERASCPDCGTPLAPKHRHPSWPGQ